METKDLFKKFRSKMVREGAIKSFLIGLTVGAAVASAIALATSAKYFTDMFKLWYVAALCAGVAVGVIVAIVLYFAVFRPDTKKIARRVDKMGLEERMITMLELQNDPSYIAMKQREDAKARLRQASDKSMRYVVARPLVVAASIMGALCLFTTGLNVLAAYTDISVIPSEPRQIVTLEYRVYNESCGRIAGESIFRLEKGADADSAVFAEASDGYEFLYWVDEMGNIIGDSPERRERNVNKDMIIYAVFGSLTIVDSNDPAQPYDPYAYPRPDRGGDEKKDPIDDNITDDDNTMTWKPNNQIKDNNTSYYGEYGPEHEDAMKELENDGALTSKHKDGVGSYYEQLNPPAPEEK